jgi:hypothetical protein
MADLEAVTLALAQSIAGMIAIPGSLTGQSKTGVQTRVFPGWPLANDLKAALAAGQAFVSVYPRSGAASNVTRHEARWKDLTASAITTTASVVANVITFAGTITLPMNIAVEVGPVKVVYTVPSGAPLSSIATALVALLVAQGVVAVADGATVAITSADDAIVRIGGANTIGREAFRTHQAYQITIWAPTQAIRAATAAAFMGSFFAQTAIDLSDNTSAMLFFKSEQVSDHSEVEGLYRRDAIVDVEFSVLETDTAFDVVATIPTIESVDYI